MVSPTSPFLPLRSWYFLPPAAFAHSPDLRALVDENEDHRPQDENAEERVVKRAPGLRDDEGEEHDRDREEEDEIEGADRKNAPVAEEREDPGGGVGAQKDGAVLMVVCAQVDDLTRRRWTGEEEHGHEKDERGERDEKEKRHEPPAADLAHAPERPPVIGINQQHDQDPDAVHPIGTHPAPFLDQPRHPGHKLSHGDAEDDGIEDGDEIERAHRASEAFSAAAGNA